MNNLYYLALLGNVNKSILHIRLGDGFQIEEWPTEKFFEVYGWNDELKAKFDDVYGYGRSRGKLSKNVYVITKSYKGFKKQYLDFHWSESRRFDEREFEIVEDKISKLRLCADGSIRLFIQSFYLYNEHEKFFELMSTIEEQIPYGDRLFKIMKSEADSINKFLNTSPLRFKQKYINLALENYVQSFDIVHEELEFLILMISLEALFNDAKQELRYKVARGGAVLLGETVDESREIFANIKKLYDKRSVLVHTGDKSKVSMSDVLLLKHYVRKALKKAVELDISKDQLSKHLSERGFGSHRKFSVYS